MKWLIDLIITSVIAIILPFSSIWKLYLANDTYNKEQAAQKVGEEAVELVIEAKDTRDDRFLEEAADLMYHYLVLIEAKDMNFTDVIDVLRNRMKKDCWHLLMGKIT